MQIQLRKRQVIEVHEKTEGWKKQVAICLQKDCNQKCGVRRQ